MAAMKAIRVQGAMFCCGAAAAVAGADVIRRLPPQVFVVLLGGLILVLGAPHGSLDALLVSRRGLVSSKLGWTVFVASYLAFAAVVVAMRWALPGLFLALFLAVSLVHFSGDPLPGARIATRILYSGAILALPTLRYADDVRHLFALLAGDGPAQLGVSALHFLALPWALALFGVALAAMRSDGLAGLELAALGGLMLFAPPLLGFTVFFCGMHGARHVLRTLDDCGPGLSRGVMAALVVPTLAVLLLLATAWHFLRGQPIEAKVIQVVFVALAALTLPHMAIVEPLRLARCRRAAEPRSRLPSELDFRLDAEDGCSKVTSS